MSTIQPVEEDNDRAKQVANHDKFTGLLMVICRSDQTIGFDNNSDLHRRETLDRDRAMDEENME